MRLGKGVRGRDGRGCNYDRTLIAVLFLLFFPAVLCSFRLFFLPPTSSSYSSSFLANYDGMNDRPLMEAQYRSACVCVCVFL